MPPRRNRKEAARRAKEQQEMVESRIRERHFLADMLFDQHESQLAMLKEQHKEEIRELKLQLAAKERELQQMKAKLRFKTKNREQNTVKNSVFDSFCSSNK
jgi:predicted phage tail protein